MNSSHLAENVQNVPHWTLLCDQHWAFASIPLREDIARGGIYHIAFGMQTFISYRTVSDLTRVDRAPIDEKVHHHFEHFRRTLYPSHFQEQ